MRQNPFICLTASCFRPGPPPLVRGSSYPRVTSGVSCPPLQVFPASPASTLSHAPRIRPRPGDATGFAHVSAGPGICPAHPAPQPGPSRLTRSPAPQPGPAHTPPRRTSREPHASPGHSPTLPRRPFLVPRARPQLSTSPASTGRVHAELCVSQAPRAGLHLCPQRQAPRLARGSHSVNLEGVRK